MTLEEDVAELSHMQNRKSAASHIFMSIWLEFMTYRPSTQQGATQQGPCVVNENQIFSRPALSLSQ